MEAATWVAALATFVMAVVAVIALIVAWRQLTNLGNTLRLNSLSAVLQIEADMNARKERVDEVTEKICSGEGTDANRTDVLQDALDSRLENWFNAVDRLAFCVLREYVPEKDWCVEYRDYISNIVIHHAKFFLPGSRYRNIIDLNNRWQRQ